MWAAENAHVSEVLYQPLYVLKVEDLMEFVNLFLDKYGVSQQWHLRKNGKSTRTRGTFKPIAVSELFEPHPG